MHSIYHDYFGRKGKRPKPRVERSEIRKYSESSADLFGTGNFGANSLCSCTKHTYAFLSSSFGWSWTKLTGVGALNNKASLSCRNGRPKACVSLLPWFLALHFVPIILCLCRNMNFQDRDPRAIKMIRDFSLAGVQSSFVQSLAYAIPLLMF